jgi:DNA mismatch endonuclease (patch repair protein)
MTSIPNLGRDPWVGVSPQRRRIMASNRRRDTTPEKRLRSILHHRGFRFRVDHPIRVPDRRPIRPDILFTRTRVAVFIDGCFWHGCPQHWKVPKSNSAYWSAKIEQNRQRDVATNRALAKAGWKVIRIWEHEQLPLAVSAVESALHESRSN